MMGQVCARDAGNQVNKAGNVTKFFYLSSIVSLLKHQTCYIRLCGVSVCTCVLRVGWVVHEILSFAQINIHNRDWRGCVRDGGKAVGEWVNPTRIPNINKNRSKECVVTLYSNNIYS